MTKICICGHFGGDKEFFDGQTVKTKNVYYALAKEYGEKEILKIDTYNWKKHPIEFMLKCIKGHKNSSNTIILPAQNGVRIFIPLFIFLNKFLKRKIFYIVVGGWLPDFLKNRNNLIKKMRKLDKIFVETNKMKRDLKDLEINNTDILINFKNIQPLDNEKIELNFHLPYKLCTFSRVMKEKGIEDAINVVKQINEEANKTIYTLDIYGQIDTSYIDKFELLQKDFPDYIKYKGCADSNKAVEVISKYFLLLFPTKFKTEGIPGTIIDALASGVPTIASEWENVNDILKDGKTGYIYKFGDLEELKKLLKNINKDDIKKMKLECLNAAGKFTQENAIKKIIKEIENVEL